VTHRSERESDAPPGSRPGRAKRPGGRPASAPNSHRSSYDQPEAIVIAVPDLDRGRLTALDRDLIGAARVLADARRGAVAGGRAFRLRGRSGQRRCRSRGPIRDACNGKPTLPAVLAPALIGLADRSHGEPPAVCRRARCGRRSRAARRGSARRTPRCSRDVVDAGESRLPGRPRSLRDRARAAARAADRGRLRRGSDRRASSGKSRCRNWCWAANRRSSIWARPGRSQRRCHWSRPS